jgi:ABC-2 type transport system permease protein
MKSLIKIEWLKIKKYPVFWWMIGIVALTYPGVNLMFYKIYSTLTTQDAMTKDAMASGVFKMLLGEPYAFPEAWHSIAYFSSAFVMVPAILVIMIINNEYTYKTNRQNIIDGWSRKDFVMSKLIDVAIISLAITVVYTITTIVFAIAYDKSMAYKMAEQLQYIPLFFLQTFSQLSLAFLAGFFIKKSFLAIGVFLMYYVIVENMIVSGLQHYQMNIYKYLPFEISDRLIPPPGFIGKFGADGVQRYKDTLAAIPLHAALTIIFTAAVWALCFKNYAKRDL